MGQNSTEVAYGFGQLGSAYSDKAQEIIPPVNHVIVAIQFLAANTPTVLRPEKLDQGGPGFIAISGSTGDDVEVAGNNYFNYNGIWTSEIDNGTYAVGDEITLNNLPSDLNRIKEGQYVVMVGKDADESGATLMAVDETNGPDIPIYNGPNRQGTTVTSWDGASKIKLSTAITSSSEALVFLDEFHGAGGITAASQVFPKGITIYGRWTAFKPSAAGVICYFGR